MQSWILNMEFQGRGFKLNVQVEWPFQDCAFHPQVA